MVKPSGKRRWPRPVYLFRGQRLRIIREKLQLTLSQVAQMTGIATSSLSDYEGGKIVPQVHQLKKLCEAYNLDPLEVCSLIKYAPL
jgi:transcriptional regulator with XRE-family HTH domain